MLFTPSLLLREVLPTSSVGTPAAHHSGLDHLRQAKGENVKRSTSYTVQTFGILPETQGAEEGSDGRGFLAPGLVSWVSRRTARGGYDADNWEQLRCGSIGISKVPAVLESIPNLFFS